MKKILCGVLLVACCWSIQAQRNLSVCYGGDATISLENVSETDKYKWETKLPDSEGWVTVKDWSSDGFVDLSDLTTSLNVRYLIDHPDYDQEADDEVLAAVITVYSQMQAGVIGPAQTICYNTAPAELTFTVKPSGAGGSYGYQWQQSAEGTSFTDIAGATAPTYQAGNLERSTWYRATVTSTACGTSATAEAVKVTVHPALQAGVVGTEQTICYNTEPASMSVLTGATGGNGVFADQWQCKPAGIAAWEDIVGETGNTYQPSALTATTQYRLKSTSDYGCGEVYSDPVTVTVYEDITAGAIGPAQTICYNTAPAELTFTVKPSGAGGSYGYQWQQSAEGTSFTDIAGATAPTYQAGNLKQTTYYRAIVTSTVCQTLDTCDILNVNLLPEFEKGEIAGGDTVCPYEIPHEMSTIVDCSGADGNYSYQWQFSDDSLNFRDIAGAIGKSYQSTTLQQTAYYRLRFTSDYGCGVLYSNSIKVLVNPTPPTQILIGDKSVCNNTYDLEYAFQDIEEDTRYEWHISGGEITEQIDDNHIIVHWDKQVGAGMITLKQTYVLTSCYLSEDYIVKKEEEAAPDKTRIMQKGHTNILICEDDSQGIHYEWGFASLSDGQETIVENSDCQYIMIPHVIDVRRYDYFVRTWFDYNGKSCETKTYWDKDILANENEEPCASCKLRIVPNPASDHFALILDRPIVEEFIVSVHTMTGQVLYQQSYAGYQAHERIDLSISLAGGVYVVNVRTEGRILTSKLIIK